MSQRNSLKFRAVLLVVGAVATLWLIAAVMTWRAAEHEAAEIFDGHLAQAASMLIAQTALEIEEPEELGDEGHAPLTHRYTRKVAFQIWERGETLLVHSQNAPAERLGAVDDGFSDRRIEGENWRVFSAWTAGQKLLVQVGERAEARQDMADELAFGLLMPLLWALPLLALLVWWAVSRALQPLTVLGEELGRRSPDRLDPLQVNNVPGEVEPLVLRLNALLQRVESALDAEKRFTGDAAHELRTPIAALSAQAQVALAEEEPVRREAALHSVLSAAERMSRLVEQLLTLARADSALPGAWRAIDLADLARQVIGDLAPGALANQVELELEAPDVLMLPAEPGWLEILLRNLIGNAIRHSPPSGIVRIFLQVGVSLPHAGAGVRIEVGDQGPGVPEALREKLGQRFWRGDSEWGDCGAPARIETGYGSGLGLSIVRRIVELHRAEIAFTASSEGGLCVRVDLPNV